MGDWSKPGDGLPEPEMGKALLIMSEPVGEFDAGEIASYHAWTDDGEPCVWETHAGRSPDRDRRFCHGSDCWMLVEANPHRKAA